MLVQMSNNPSGHDITGCCSKAFLRGVSAKKLIPTQVPSCFCHHDQDTRKGIQSAQRERTSEIPHGQGQTPSRIAAMAQQDVKVLYRRHQILLDLHAP